MDRITILGLGLAAAVVTCAPALARTAVASAQVSQTVITTKDLDLSSKDGVATLKLRLNEAAIRVCGSAPDNRDLERGDIYRACTTKAKLDAVRLLGNAEVSAAYGLDIEHAAAAVSQPKG